MKKVKAAVFASGTGTNFQAIMEKDNLFCEIVLLVCDKPGATVIEKAKGYGVQEFVFLPNSYSSKVEYERELLEKLREKDVEWIFLAGYMRIVGQTLLDAFEHRIVNIHPSMLPKFPGKDAFLQAFQAGVNKTGVTVHFVDTGIDTGPIIAQQEINIYPDDTLETLEERIHRVEHQLYPQVINQLIANEKE
ncbi:phosphoribosylglycinamide formyltransferase [Lederbergia sp. NSJ-179]|uniref:phosphoribosylglycinamide formyltransferase n=1 Tax=Lederbergia sp. NSJ-179 TaxID=2931402 RepID=UPI001FD496FA|nr:phosphoribosylglycinamide formyltransferase [Lederbergia sp. NSJ-179]MCJ7840995.1 phosphoribosylglycinamide formyltransferase [Lederbergia sp. NSJ-179]